MPAPFKPDEATMIRAELRELATKVFDAEFALRKATARLAKAVARRDELRARLDLISPPSPTA